MKKQILLVWGVLFLASFSYAQDLCRPCGHRISPTYSYAHVFCETIPVPSTCDSIDAGLKGPVIFALVTYRMVTCENKPVQLLVDGVVLMDERAHYTTVCGGLPHNCNYPDPLSPNDIITMLGEAIDSVVANQRLTTDVEVIYKGSCSSLAQVEFKEKIYMLQGRGDAGGVDTVWLHPESKIWQTVPCGDACCKVKYKFEIVTGKEGETIMTWKPESWAGDNGSCKEIDKPDYDAYRNRIFAFSASNPADTIYAQVISQTDCQAFCETVYAPPPPGDKAPRFTTDLAEVKDPLPLKLSAHPTLCSSFIRFTTNKPISKVVVYDMAGKRVTDHATLTNDELNTSALKPGIYYVQVYFSEQEVKTIKIRKQ